MVFDILVIGGGHAGLEAVWLAHQFGLKIGLISLEGVSIGSTPCNPSIGGVGKGQVVREIDALGGLMGELADCAGIQYRTLNESKGDAVRSTRVQIDKVRYSQSAEKKLSELQNLSIIRDQVVRVKKDDELFSIEVASGVIFKTEKLVVTVGTFLKGKLHTGTIQKSGGREGQSASAGLGDLFDLVAALPHRFKTGTPPRLEKSSIDFTKMLEQPSEGQTPGLHWANMNKARLLPQMSCYLTYTNLNTMTYIREHRKSSPLFNGQIQGIGARYCPSIEDKAFRYPDKQIHHVFVEPESEFLESYYPSGLSSALPIDVQLKYVRTVLGLEEAVISTPGYAVEYDVLDTSQLNSKLECRNCPGLYFAGQVNGTSGYEEAAGQGLVAGVNAALSILGRSEFILSRFDSYIGVMIDDLISGKRDEPYRLFTARAENRLFLREDNAWERMWSYRTTWSLNTDLDQHLSAKTEEKSQLIDSDWSKETETHLSISEDICEHLRIDQKYEGYLKRDLVDWEKVRRLGEKRVSWKKLLELDNLSFECRERISSHQPETFHQLKSIPGIRPATLASVASRF